MVLSVTGGSITCPMDPWQDVIEVYGDYIELLGTMRIAALNDIAAYLKANPTLDTGDMHMELLRKLKVRLIDTGLTEYPEDEAERLRQIERVINVLRLPT